MKKTLNVFKLFGNIEGGRTFHQLFDEMQNMLRGDNAKRKMVYPVILISSTGGALEEAIRAYSFLRSFFPTLTTVAFGPVESAAVFIYLAGKHRFCLPTTSFLIHQGTTQCGPCPPSEMTTVLKTVQIKTQMQIDIFKRECGTSQERVEEWLRNGQSFSAEEAKRAKLVHKIVSEPLFTGVEVMI